jgi:hypothetical protein
MKMKKVLILSLAVNVICLGALGYIQSMEVIPAKIPPIIYVVDKSDPAAISAAVEAASLPNVE